MRVRTINNTCLRIYVRVMVLLVVVVVVPFSCRQENGQEPEDKTTQTTDDSSGGNGGGSGTGGGYVPRGYTETLCFSGLFPIDTCYAGVTGEVDYRRADVYVCDHLWAGLMISQVGDFVYDPWRLPTRKEAAVLKTLEVFDKDRYVCLDAETGEYYTFKYGGSVTKAGEKTKYSVRPIRVEYKSDSIIVYL